MTDQIEFEHKSSQQDSTPTSADDLESLVCQSHTINSVQNAPIRGTIANHRVRVVSAEEGFELEQGTSGEMYVSKTDDSLGDGEIITDSETVSVANPVVTQISEFKNKLTAQNREFYIPLKRSTSDSDEQWYKKIEVSVEVIFELESDELFSSVYYPVTVSLGQSVQNVIDKSYLSFRHQKKNPTDTVRFVLNSDGTIKLRQNYQYFDYLCEKLPHESVEIDPSQKIEDVGQLGLSLSTVITLTFGYLALEVSNALGNVFAVATVVSIPVIFVFMLFKYVSVTVYETSYYSGQAISAQDGIFLDTTAVDTTKEEVRSPDEIVTVQLISFDDELVFTENGGPREWTVQLQNGFIPQPVTELLYDAGFESLSDESQTVAVRVAQTRPVQSEYAIETSSGKWIYKS